MSEQIYEAREREKRRLEQERQRVQERFAAPCRDCGFTGPRWHPITCDECRMRDFVFPRRRWARERAARQAERDATGEALAGLPAGRRRLVEMSGAAFSSPADIYVEAYGEW